MADASAGSSAPAPVASVDVQDSQPASGAASSAASAAASSATGADVSDAVTASDGDVVSPRSAVTASLGGLPWDVLLNIFEYFPNVFVHRVLSRVCRSVAHTVRNSPTFVLDLPRVRAVVSGKPAQPVQVRC